MVVVVVVVDVVVVVVDVVVVVVVVVVVEVVVGVVEVVVVVLSLLFGRYDSGSSFIILSRYFCMESASFVVIDEPFS